MIPLDDYINQAELKRLIETARREDLGPDGLDATSACFIHEAATGSADFVNREQGTIAGLSTLQTICTVYGGRVKPQSHHTDGDLAKAGARLATIDGPMRDLLAIERVALNLLTHLSGIATLTAQYVARCEGTKAKVYDTRKTLPGLRGLQKYAVACGGGKTHRMGLYDAVLIKDNHLAGTPLDRLAERLAESAGQARRLTPGIQFVMVEVDTLDQFSQVLKAPIDIALLDNMPLSTLTQAVAMRDQQAPEIQLEASGGVNLDTVGNIAKTGVDRISVGALTHSAPSLDIGLDIE
ncbi:MAG: carboxylating nicotinate-nucleotide diphosphorylase [Phycisphaeraceae bacterium]|nr:carboxylating nicotinate-nucleotide diphosphorylase [Phycisphaeraceae bacterium]